MPLAIQSNMSIDLFWYGEEKYFEAYVKAHFENMNYQAWITGQYSYIAQMAIMSNIFKDKNSKGMSYPNYKSVDEHKEKQTNTEQEARDIISSCY